MIEEPNLQLVPSLSYFHLQCLEQGWHNTNLTNSEQPTLRHFQSYDEQG